MASGGMGDVLTGVIGALVAQSLSGVSACLLGVFAQEQDPQRGLDAVAWSTYTVPSQSGPAPELPRNPAPLRPLGRALFEQDRRS